MKKVLTVLLGAALLLLTIFFIVKNTNWIISGAVILSALMGLAFWLSLISEKEEEHD